MERKNFGFRDRLRLAVDRSPYDQKGLAQELETREATVSGWLDDKGPTMPQTKFLLRLPKILGVRPEWLFYGEAPMTGGELAVRLTVIGRIVDGTINDAVVREILERLGLPEATEAPADALGEKVLSEDLRAAGKDAVEESG